MARTNKRGGNTAKLKHSSPNKIFLGMPKGMMGAIGGKINSLFGRGGGAGAAQAQVAEASKLPKAGAVWGGGGPNLPGGAPGMGTALVKRTGFKKYKCEKCPSPLRGADAVLVRGAYDAASGKGTTKYGMIAKTRAMGEIARTIGTTVASWARVQAPKRRVSMKKNLKNQMKTNKLRQRKSKGWLDKQRYA